MRLLITTSGIALLMVLVVSLGTKPVTMRIVQNQAQAAGTATPTPTATAIPTAIPTCGPSTYDIGNQFAAPAAACSPGAFLEGNGLDVCNKVNQYICATPIPSSGQPIFTHALTGTTPLGVCNSATIPAVDVQTYANSASPTTITLPAGCANGEIMTWHIHQTSSGGTITLPSGTIGPFSAAGGTTVVGTGTNCALGTNQSPPDDLDANFQLDGTVWRLEACNAF